MESERDTKTGSAFPTLPYELLLQILSDLEPFELLQLSQTCKQLHEILTDKDIWKEALREMCRRNDVFEPSFPIDEMEVRELQRAALGPTLWQNKVNRHAKMGLDGPIPFIERTFGGDYEQGLSPSGSFAGVHLVPGGRYLISLSGESITLWDLGPRIPAHLKKEDPKVVDTFSMTGTGLWVENATTPLSQSCSLRFGSLLCDFDNEVLTYRLFEVGPLPEDGRIRKIWEPRIGGTTLNLFGAGVAVFVVGWRYVALLKGNSLTVCDVSREEFYSVSLNAMCRNGGDFAVGSFRIVNDYFVGVVGDSLVSLWRIKGLNWRVLGDVKELFSSPKFPNLMSQSSYVCDFIFFTQSPDQRIPTIKIVRYKVDLSPKNAGQTTKNTWIQPSHSPLCRFWPPGAPTCSDHILSSHRLFILSLQGENYYGDEPFFAVMSTPIPTQSSEGSEWAYAHLQPLEHWRYRHAHRASLDAFTGQLAYPCGNIRGVKVGDSPTCYTNEIHMLDFLWEYEGL